MGPTESATAAFIKSLPEGDLMIAALAANALTMAHELDSDNSATSKSMCSKAHSEIVDRLRELVPPEEKKGLVHDIRSARRGRLRIAGGADTED